MTRVNEYLYSLGSKRSVIRELFEFGKKRRQELGDDKVYDFSIGNPSVPAPACVREAVIALLSSGDNTDVHCYSSSQGFPEVRKAIADDINRRFNAGVRSDDLYMTCGAAAGLSIAINALNEGSDEVVIFAPFFPEYHVFIKASGAKPVIVPFDPANFQIDFEAFEKSLSPKTKLVIYNSPNNPSGVVYTRETLEKMCGILRAKEKEFGHPIYVVSDEPYREIVYGDVEVPYIMNLYDNSIVCYSYSKSLSLPGERIGFLAVCPRMEGRDEVYLAICGAGRALGYVCAPSLFQKVVAKVVGTAPDIEAYSRNRDALYGGLTEIGYECVRPDGAFYLFVKALEENSNAFAEKAKQFGLLLVPADSFCAPGYVRIAYCVSYEMILRSMPAFRDLFESYRI